MERSLEMRLSALLVDPRILREPPLPRRGDGTLRSPLTGVPDPTGRQETTTDAAATAADTDAFLEKLMELSGGRSQLQASIFSSPLRGSEGNEGESETANPMLAPLQRLFGTLSAVFLSRNDCRFVLGEAVRHWRQAWAEKAGWTMPTGHGNGVDASFAMTSRRGSVSSWMPLGAESSQPGPVESQPRRFWDVLTAPVPSWTNHVANWFQGYFRARLPKRLVPPSFLPKRVRSTTSRSPTASPPRTSRRSSISRGRRSSLAGAKSPRKQRRRSMTAVEREEWEKRAPGPRTLQEEWVQVTCTLSQELWDCSLMLQHSAQHLALDPEMGSRPASEAGGAHPSAGNQPAPQQANDSLDADDPMSGPGVVWAGLGAGDDFQPVQLGDGETLELGPNRFRRMLDTRVMEIFLQTTHTVISGNLLAEAGDVLDLSW